MLPMRSPGPVGQQGRREGWLAQGGNFDTAAMLSFQARPDRVFLAILHEALQRTREELDFAPTYTPTHEGRAEMDEHYRVMYPEITRFFERRELLNVLDCLLEASRQSAIYEITDYHWLVVYECLAVFCDLHNDGVLGDDGEIGPHVVDTIDFEALVSRFFSDTDFRMGAVLLQAEERKPGHVQASRQAWKIAAGLRPDPEDLQIARVERSEEEIWPADPDERSVPESGYVGPYPRLEPDDGAE